MYTIICEPVHAVSCDYDINKPTTKTKMEKIDILQFMEEIRKYPVIWNKFSSEFKNKYLKCNACKAVGDVIKISPELAEKKYVNIRTVYRRFLKKDALGSRRVDDPQRAMYAQLAWLKPYIKQKKSFTNLSSLDDENVQFVVPSQRSDIDNFNLDGDAETTTFSETIDDLNDDDAFNATNEESIGEEIVVSSSNMLTTQTTINSSSVS